jgi:hypothetical protein
MQLCTSLRVKGVLFLYYESEQTKTVVTIGRDTTYSVVVSSNWSFESRSK